MPLDEMRGQIRYRGLADTMLAHDKEEQLAMAGFLAKPREHLTATHPLKFNGGLITYNSIFAGAPGR